MSLSQLLPLDPCVDLLFTHLGLKAAGRLGICCTAWKSKIDKIAQVRINQIEFATPRGWYHFRHSEKKPSKRGFKRLCKLHHTILTALQKHPGHELILQRYVQSRDEITRVAIAVKWLQNCNLIRFYNVLRNEKPVLPVEHTTEFSANFALDWIRKQNPQDFYRKEEALEITLLPIALCELNYTAFRLSSVALTAIPPAMDNLKNLTRLEINHNQIKTLPRSLSQLKNLEVVDISSNKLKKISGFVFALPKLKRLYLQNNKISQVPKRVKKLSSLEILNLSHNRIGYLPRQLLQLSQLKICVAGNNITNLPEHSVRFELKGTEYYVIQREADRPQSPLESPGEPELLSASDTKQSPLFPSP